MSKSRPLLVIATACLLAAGVLTGPLQGSKRLELKFQVYQGTRSGTLLPPKFAGSYSLQPAFSAHLLAGPDMESEKSRIRWIFNLEDINFITDANLIIGEGGHAPDRVRQAFRLNGNIYQVLLLITEFKPPLRLFALLQEKTADGFQNIFGQTIEMKGGHSSIIGIEDRSGKTYFLTFRVTGPAEMVPPATLPPPPPPPMPEENKKVIEEFERGAVNMATETVPVRLLKQIDPVPPPDAPAGGGHVSLNVRTDEKGNVKRVMVIYSSNKAFEEPAVNAVRQWKYEPSAKDGKAREAVFTVTVRFDPR